MECLMQNVKMSKARPIITLICHMHTFCIRNIKYVLQFGCFDKSVSVSIKMAAESDWMNFGPGI